MADNSNELPIGCHIEKFADVEKWVATCNDALTGESVYVGPDGGPLGYNSPDFQKRVFDSKEAAISAALLGHRVFGLGSADADPHRRQREALERIASGDIKVEIRDKELFNAIEPNQLRAYLKSVGWKKVGSGRKDGIEIWSAGKDDFGGEMTTPIVRDRRFVDYGTSLGYTVRYLSGFLRKSELLIVKEMLEIDHATAESELRE